MPKGLSTEFNLEKNADHQTRSNRGFLPQKRTPFTFPFFRVVDAGLHRTPSNLPLDPRRRSRPSRRLDSTRRIRDFGAYFGSSCDGDYPRHAGLLVHVRWFPNTEEDLLADRIFHCGLLWSEYLLLLGIQEANDLERSFLINKDDP